MKRAAILLLAVILAVSVLLPAGAADSYTLPEPLKTVPARVEKLGLPEDLPPQVAIRSFSEEEGTVRLELEAEVPKLRIIEKSRDDDAGSTIFTKKNASSADAHTVGTENAGFLIRMIWNAGSVEYVREYSFLYDYLSFVSFTASEKADASAFAPYTSAVRSISYSEASEPLSETWTLENDSDRLIRTAAYGRDGALTSVSQTWEAVKAGGYRCVLETDAGGNVIGLYAGDQKSSFYAQSLRIGENPEFADLIADGSVDSGEVDYQLEEKYPQLESGLFDFDGSTGWTEEFLAEWDRAAGSYADPEDWDDEDEEDDEDWDDEDDPDDMDDPDENGAAGSGDPDENSASDPDDEDESGSAGADDEDSGNGSGGGEPAPAPTVTANPRPANPGNLPLIPAYARVWTLNFHSYFDDFVYAYISADPLLVLRDGKPFLNQKAKDISGRPVKPGISKINAPAMEPVKVEK